MVASPLVTAVNGVYSSRVDINWHKPSAQTTRDDRITVGQQGQVATPVFSKVSWARDANSILSHGSVSTESSQGLDVHWIILGYWQITSDYHAAKRKCVNSFASRNRVKRCILPCNGKVQLSSDRSELVTPAAPNVYHQIRSTISNWLVVLTVLKNISPWEGLSPYIMENKIHVWNHQPANDHHHSSSHIISVRSGYLESSTWHILKIPQTCSINWALKLHIHIILHSRRSLGCLS